MKVWFIYYTGDLSKISVEYIGDNDDDVNNSRLYGITSDKKLLKEFLSIRNQDVFKIKKRDILPSEYDDLTSSDLRKAVIDRYNLATKYGKYVTIALTDYEYQIATDDFVINSLCDDVKYWREAPNPTLFNNKIKKALYTIQYAQFYNVINGTDDEGYDAPAIDPDELRQFIDNFTITLKEA